EVSLDWNTTLASALVHRPELRRQKWNIKSLELQHTAASKLVRPRLDFVASYAVNAFGDQLTGDGPNYHSAYATLLSGDHTNWGLGFEFSMPFGFRAAVTQVQNYEHRLAKARAILAQQELEISHELANSLQQIDQTYQTAKTNFNRRRAAERRVQAFEAEFKVQRTTLDLVLRAQISLAAAETAYYSSLVSYNRALNDLKFRKGTILTENSVFLTEGVWQEEAYDDALRRAWERSFAIDVSDWMDETEPEEFVFGCPTCHPTEAGAEPMPEDLEAELPYENPPPPLEGLAPEAAPKAALPAADRAAQFNPEAEAGGLGTELVPPYEEPVLPPARPTLLIPDSPATIPLIPESGTASPNGTPTSGIPLKPVEFLQPVPAAGSVPHRAEPGKSPVSASELIQQPVSSSAVRKSSSPTVGATSIPDETFPLPVPTDGGLSGRNPVQETLPVDPFGESQPSAGSSSGHQPLHVVPARSRRELLQTVSGSVSNDSREVFSTPIDITDGDDFPSPLNRTRVDSEPLPDTGIPSGAAVQKTAAERSAGPHFSLPAPGELPRKKSAFPSWGRFFKRAD
ncbi:MAG: TolC family protein, partial [Planctomycetaceae bacterium]